MNKTILLTACLVLALSGCAEMETKSAAANPELDKAIADAEQAVASAKKVGIWRDTEKTLKAAKEDKAAGKTDEAMKKAKKALKEAQLAEKQAIAEANAKPSYPK
jgi:protein involved in sex pheromone biosynthesis